MIIEIIMTKTIIIYNIKNFDISNNNINNVILELTVSRNFVTKY